MEHILFYTALSLIFILFTFKFLFQSKRRRYTNLPPSPPSLPIIGHLHLLKPPFHRTFHRLSKTYGPIYSLWFGSRRVVIVSSEAAVEECFIKNDVVLANRPRMLCGKYLAYNSTAMVAADYGDHWRNLRRMASIEIFSSQRLNMFSTVRKDEVKNLLRKLSKNSSSGNFAKVEMKSMFSQLSFNIVMTMVAGKRYYGDDESENEEAKKFRQIIREVFVHSDSAHPADLLPFLNWLDFGRYEKKVRELGRKKDAFLQGLIEEHRTAGVKRNTMIDHLLSLQDSHPEYYTDEIIKGFIMVLIMAGTDTSAVALEWAMCNLINHPHVLKKAREEVDSRLGLNHLVDETDVSKLPYLQSIILETLRLYPPAPLLLPHYSSEYCTIGGFDVPPDTIVSANAWAIHRDPELWDDPECFKPERFQSGLDVSHKIVSFGLGRRACPGESMARCVMGLTLGSLIQCFEWEKVHDKETDMNEGKGFNMSKVVPLEAMCRARPIANKVLT